MHYGAESFMKEPTYFYASSFSKEKETFVASNTMAQKKSYRDASTVPAEIILPHAYCVLPSTKVIISLERKCKKFFLLEIPLSTHCEV